MVIDFDEKVKQICAAGEWLVVELSKLGVPQDKRNYHCTTLGQFIAIQEELGVVGTPMELAQMYLERIKQKWAKQIN